MPSPSLTGRDDEGRSLRELEVLTVAEIEAIVISTESEHEGVWTRRISKSLHDAIAAGLVRNRLIAAAPDMYEALKEARLQIEYLHEMFQETGTGNAVLARISAVLSQATAKQER
jgi:hypothetical protein